MGMTGGRLCLGLHVTKCAGTSLITTLRRRLSDDEYYFCSSYHENWLAGRPLFAQIRAPERLRMVFGHYVHQDLLGVFAGRDVFLFTGLRDPVARAISDYRQMNAVRAQAGAAPIEGIEYIAGHGDAMCAEVLRAFPLAAGDSLFARAQAALEMFDYIYDTDDIDAQMGTVFEVLDIPEERLASDNISSGKHLPMAFDAVMQRGCDTILRDRGFIAQDIALWEWVRPRLGRMVVPVSRAGFVANDAMAARAAFCARETEYLVHEFDALGRLGALRLAAEEWAGTARAVIARVGEYGRCGG